MDQVFGLFPPVTQVNAFPGMPQRWLQIIPLGENKSEQGVRRPRDWQPPGTMPVVIIGKL
jgi:hypothetical protein